MKISKQQTKKNTAIDFDMLIKDLLAEHGNIFFADIGEQIYIYKALGRKAYKGLVNNPNISPIELEDKICEEVILYPEDFNADECDAGVPTELYEQILTNSFLSSTEDMINLLEACREEVDQLDIQMSCIISEAFPAYDMDEIEEWDMIKFCRMYAKAEWKLKNMRNSQLNVDVVDFLKESNGIDTSEQSNNIVEEEQPNKPVAPTQTSNSKIKVGNREMSKAEYEQYLEFRRKYPEMNWEQDAMFTGYETQTVDTVPVPLRTRN